MSLLKCLFFFRIGPKGPNLFGGTHHKRRYTASKVLTQAVWFHGSFCFCIVTSCLIFLQCTILSKIESKLGLSSLFPASKTNIV